MSFFRAYAFATLFLLVLPVGVFAQGPTAYEIIKRVEGYVGSDTLTFVNLVDCSLDVPPKPGCAEMQLRSSQKNLDVLVYGTRDSSESVAVMFGAIDTKSKDGKKRLNEAAGVLSAATQVDKSMLIAWIKVSKDFFFEASRDNTETTISDINFRSWRPNADAEMLFIEASFPELKSDTSVTGIAGFESKIGDSNHWPISSEFRAYRHKTGLVVRFGEIEGKKIATITWHADNKKAGEMAIAPYLLVPSIGPEIDYKYNRDTFNDWLDKPTEYCDLKGFDVHLRGIGKIVQMSFIED